MYSRNNFETGSSMHQNSFFDVIAFYLSIVHEPMALIGLSFDLWGEILPISFYLLFLLSYHESPVSYTFHVNAIIFIFYHHSLVPTPPPPPKQPPPSGGCFPSTARVTLKNGKSITMSELQTGDKVQTGRGIGFTLVTKILSLAWTCWVIRRILLPVKYQNIFTKLCSLF